MFILAGVMGVLCAFALLELIVFLELDGVLLGTVPRLWAGLLVGGAFGGFIIEVVERLSRL